MKVFQRVFLRVVPGILALAMGAALVVGCENPNQGEPAGEQQGTDQRGKAAVPAAAPGAGAVAAGTTVALSTATEGAAIYYTLNGELPTKDSSRYQEAIAVSAGLTIKALAVKEGLEDSGVLEAAYTIAGGTPGGTDDPPAGGYTVRFDMNGGGGAAPADIRVSASGKRLGDLPPAPSRSGYVFGGWNTARDGRGAEVVPALGVSGDLTAYALWWEDIGEFDDLDEMAEALAERPENDPGTAYAVRLGDGVRFEDMAGTIMVGVGTPSTEVGDGLAGLRAAAAGRYIAADLRGISQTGGSAVPGGPWEKAHEDRYTETNDYLVSMRLPAWVTTIGEYAFCRLRNLKSINLEETGVSGIGDSAFFDTGIVSIKFPASLNSLAAAFAGSTKLISVDMGEMSISALPTRCFEGCSALREIRWPPQLESIGMYAFAGAGFVTLEIPPTVNEIKLGAFSKNTKLVWFKWHEAPAGASGVKILENCGRLLRIEFPVTMTGVTTDVSFKNCTRLETVILPLSISSPSAVPTVTVDPDDKNLPGTNAEVKIYVPADAVENYLHGFRWMYIPTIEEIICSLEDLPESERPENWPEA
jgi:uncharacterized repeat protein (TIGR02543 family)